MDWFAQGEARPILRNVRTLDDLSVEVIHKLVKTNGGRMTIYKFQIGLADFLNWYQPGSFRGVEYDSQSKRVMVKAIDCYVHDQIAQALGEWLEKVTADLQSDNYPFFQLVTKDKGLRTLQGSYNHCVKEPDLAIMVRGRTYPILAVEIGVTDCEERLYEEAQKWLRGTDGQTKMVILVHVQEWPRAHAHDSLGQEGERWWGLNPFQIRDYDGPVGHMGLGRHIIRWYQENGHNIVGTLTADISLISQSGIQRFSLGEFSRSLRDINQAHIPLLQSGPIVGFPITKLDLLRGEYPDDHFKSLEKIRQVSRQFAEEGDKRAQTDGVFYLPLESLRNSIHSAISVYQVQRAEYKAKKMIRYTREQYPDPGRGQRLSTY